jgi:hypothetical protein
MYDIDIKTYQSGVLIKILTKQLFFPYKSIELINMDKKETDKGPVWILFIKASGEKFNLSCNRDISGDFIDICMHYKQ